MPTDPAAFEKQNMPLAARRVFRLSFCIALSLAIAYAMALPLPYLVPIFALMLGLKPAPPLAFKVVIGVLVILVITMGIGLLLTPVLLNYPLTGILIVAGGLYFSSYMTVIAGKALLGTLLTVGFTLITAAGMANFSLAITVVQGLAFAVIISALCQWLVYPWFPEDNGLDSTNADTATADALTVDSGTTGDNTDQEPEPENHVASNWIALRATLIILPAYYVTLINPGLYLPIIMKAVSLGQQSSVLQARDAARELLGSTFLGGVFAIVVWFTLDLVTTLWVYSSLMLLCSLYVVSKLYALFNTKFSPLYWQNVCVTMLILLGSAVQDSSDGNDVYRAFAVRMGLFVVVTLYACLAIYWLEWLAAKRLSLRLQKQSRLS